LAYRYIPDLPDGEGNTEGCSGSGTPSAEFGSEAARTPWRTAVGWLLYEDERAAEQSRTFAAQFTEKMNAYDPASCTGPSSCAAMRLDKGCLVTSIHASWLWNEFMLGPMSSALTVPPIGSPAEQQAAIDQAGLFIQERAIEHYYSVRTHLPPPRLPPPPESLREPRLDSVCISLRFA
jgi:hypothetical protein